MEVEFNQSFVKLEEDKGKNCQINGKNQLHKACLVEREVICLIKAVEVFKSVCNLFYVLLQECCSNLPGCNQQSFPAALIISVKSKFQKQKLFSHNV